MPKCFVGSGNRMPITVAILGAGSLFGQGLIKALKISSLDVRLVGIDFFPHAVGLYWTHSAHLLPDILNPAVHEEDYVQRLIHILNQEKADVLLVAVDFEIPRMAKHRSRMENQTHCRVVVSSPDVADIGDDKWATHQFLKKYAFPCQRMDPEK